MRYDRILALIALLVLGVSCKQYEDMPEDGHISINSGSSGSPML